MPSIRTQLTAAVQQEITTFLQDWLARNPRVTTVDTLGIPSPTWSRLLHGRRRAGLATLAHLLAYLPAHDRTALLSAIVKTLHHHTRRPHRP